MNTLNSKVQNTIKFDDCMDILKGFDSKNYPKKPKKEIGYPHKLRVRCDSQISCNKFAKIVRQHLKSEETKFVFNPNSKVVSKNWKYTENRTNPKKKKTSHRTRLESKLWIGLVEFENDPIEYFQVFELTFKNEHDYAEFARRIKKRISIRTQTIYFPSPKVEDKKYTWVSNVKKVNPKYPIYIISKGRPDSRLTSRTLERMNVPYSIVIEPQEYDSYECVIDSKKIKVLPFSNHGMGSGPARNWCADDARSLGKKRHWVLDDNIDGFYRLHQNKKQSVSDGLIFQLAEEFVDRYKNVPLAGFAYDFQTIAEGAFPPFVLNTRCFSCLLIDSNSKHKWRGRYNEDIDLTLRILKDGLCTIQFYAFLQGKIGTQTLGGGNTDEFYAEEGTYNKSEMLRRLHPDVVKTTWRYGRPHHEVNLRVFNKKNKLIPQRKKHRKKHISTSLVVKT